MTTTDRFADQKLTIADFTDRILVVCPQCGACASVLPLPGGDTQLFAMRRLACQSCGLVKDKKVRQAIFGRTHGPVDSYFEMPLWLVAHQGTESLWAYNLEHLTYIESFVAAAHRTRNLDAPGCLNCSIISRLPRWIKKAGNRQKVLAMIQKLKNSIPKHLMG